MLVSMWISAHFLAALLYWPRVGRQIIPIAFLMVLLVYLGKGLSFDLHSYLEHIALKRSQFEGGYEIFIRVFQLTGLSPQNILSIVQCILAGLLMGCGIIWSPSGNKLTVVTLLLLSVAFFLSVENAIRQGFAAAFLIVGFAQLTSRSRFDVLSFFACVGLASQFHRSSALFGGVLFSVYLLVSISDAVCAKCGGGKNRYSFGLMNLHIGLIFFAVGIVVGVTAQHFLSLVGYETYAVFGVPSGRTHPFVKLVPLAVLFTISEVCWGNCAEELRIRYLRYSRTAFFSLMAAMCIFEEFYEVFSRVMLFYLLLDALLLASKACGNKADRFGASITTASYGFALNVINIISASI